MPRKPVSRTFAAGIRLGYNGRHLRWRRKIGESTMFKKVCFHRDLAGAEMIRNLLEENGFHPMKLDYSAHISVAGAEQGYFIEVPKQEADRAKAVLADNNLEKHIVVN